jgi:hypothetical protein
MPHLHRHQNLQITHHQHHLKTVIADPAAENRWWAGILLIAPTCPLDNGLDNDRLEKMDKDRLGDFRSEHHFGIDSLICA